jgi:23S rRNA (guanosine2251-2'-O)-methyltransferase
MARPPELVMGRIPVLEALTAGKREAFRLYVLESAEGISAILRAATGIRVQNVSRAELDRMTKGAVHQGVVLEAAPLPVFRAEDWVRSDFPENALVVLLDGVEDPHNFGAIVRTAAALGATAVVFGKDRAAPISPTSVKSAAGAMEYIDLVEAVNLTRTVELLQKVGFWVAALDADAKQDLWSADLGGRTVLVIGSEGEGIHRNLAKHCDFHLRIPLDSPISSLNASVSAAIAMAEWLRQKNARQK